jgi:hypothetical protein
LLGQYRSLGQGRQERSKLLPGRPLRFRQLHLIQARAADHAIGVSETLERLEVVGAF